MYWRRARRGRTRRRRRRTPAARCRTACPALRQRLRHRAVEHLLRQRREIARRAVGARLVLRLHHDHGALRIDLLQVPHQSHERLAVRLQRRLRMRRQRVERAAVGGDHAREALVVQLHPGRRVIGAVVLPGREPQQDQPHVALARLRQQRIEEGEIERAFLGSICSQAIGTITVLGSSISIAGHTCGSIAG